MSGRIVELTLGAVAAANPCCPSVPAYARKVVCRKRPIVDARPENRTTRWLELMESTRRPAPAIEVVIDGANQRLDTSTPAAKQAAFDRLHGWLRGLPSEQQLQQEIGMLCASHGVDEAAICRELCMSWDELKTFADDPLISVGAHSITHCNLARQTEEIATQEMAVSRARIAGALQRPVVHLAYPYGDRIAAGTREFALAEATGYQTAVTPRPGMIFPASAAHLTALPRVSLNGNYQDARILPVLTSGAATAMRNGFRRIDAE